MDGVVRTAAWWLGRKTLSVADFRSQFGIYPSTVVHVQRLVPVDQVWLLKALWWLKTYPTEQQIKNQRASVAHFRKKLWTILELLKSSLPEVRIRFSFLLFFSPVNAKFRSCRSTCAGC
jgi:hypothetical protein